MPESTSKRFIEMVKSSDQRVVTKFEVIRGDELLDTVTTAMSGTLTAEKNVDIRRQATISFVDERGTLTPSSPSDLLTPFGNELRVWYGYQFNPLDPSDVEYVPMITGRMRSVGGAWPQIDVQIVDRSRRISRARFTEPYTVTAGVNYGTAIQDLLTSRMGNADFNFESTEHTTPRLVFTEDDDPWQKAREMANSCGMELFVNPMGIFCLRGLEATVVDPSEAVWQFKVDNESVMLGLTKEWTDEETYNGVVASGENTDNGAVPYAVVWDDDPQSPTYYLGDYGMVPFFYVSPFIKTVDQARSAAVQRLTSVIGIEEKLVLPTTILPHLDVGDHIYVVKENTKVDGIYTIDTMQVPLSATNGAMEITVRSKRTEFSD